MRIRRVPLVAFYALLAGCSGRFSSLRDGTYTCQADVTTNTCGPTVPSRSMSVPLEGGGTDTVSVLAPSEVDVFGPTGWQTVQFGAQSEPYAYDATSTAGCGTGSFTAQEEAVLTDVGTDRLVMRLTYTYAGLGAGCVSPAPSGGACVLAYQVRCTRTP